ncbi:rubrerythrin family protein [Halolamina sp. C58]|uniref:rubrerythrin family protein n=1 Tax=Halolamina sp. C58 TaxID=3421640 RepID=UPI003EBC09B2
MDGATFREQVTDAKRTQLNRLGSNKLLVALTDADLTPRRVLEAAADSEHAAHTTFTAWAEDEPNDLARETFAAVAEREADHRERVLDAMDGEYEPNDGGALHEYLRGREGAVLRVAAGMVGRGLVADRTHQQVVSFFVNEADNARADLFRELRRETASGTERGLELLETLCESESDWTDARDVAEYTIQVAYDDYADALRGMGVDPKPVC